MADEILDRFEVLGSEVKRYAHISGGDRNLALAIAKLRKGGDIATELSVIEQLRSLGYLQSKIARELNMSRADVSRRLSIIDNLISPLKERVVDGELRISTAWELSKLSPEIQKEYAEKDNITLAEVQERRRIETIGKFNLGDIKIPEQKAPESFKLKLKECEKNMEDEMKGAIKEVLASCEQCKKDKVNMCEACPAYPILRAK